MLGMKKQRPDDRLDYDVDFSRWLDEDDTITDATVVAIGMDVDSVSIFGQVVKVWLSGGEAGKTYEVEVTATTANGRVKEETFILRVTGC